MARSEQPELASGSDARSRGKHPAERDGNSAHSRSQASSALTRCLACAAAYSSHGSFHTHGIAPTQRIVSSRRCRKSRPQISQSPFMVSILHEMQCDPKLEAQR